MDREEYERLIFRLENWGRWSREGRKANTSSLHSVMKHLGYLPENAGPGSQAPSVLTEDAELVDKAWRSLPAGVERKFLAIEFCGKNRGRREVALAVGFPYDWFSEVKHRAIKSIYVTLQSQSSS